MIRLEVSGEKQIKDELAGMARRVKDLTPAYRVGAEIIRKLIDDSFAKARDPWGNAWPDWKKTTLPSGRIVQRTLERRRQGKNRRKPKGRLLVDTGLLRNSITAIADTSGILFGSVYEQRRHPETGEPVAGYASVHQFGSEDGTVPQRAFLPIKDPDAREIHEPAGSAAAKAMDKVFDVIGRFIESGSTRRAA
jgi:phage gpG-like protein